LIPLIDAIPPIAGKVGHPVQRPEEVFADRAYDSDPHRDQLAQRGIDAGISVSTHTILTSFNVRYALDTAAMLCDLGAYRSKLTNYGRSLAHHSESFWVGGFNSETQRGWRSFA
jgi:hypothetical protein